MAAEALAKINPSTFDYLRRTLQSITGIALTESKMDLMVGRLRRRLAELKLESFEAYSDYLRSLPDNHAEWQNFANCLTTNKTDFFREDDHFRFLINEALPQWLSRRTGQPLRLWSVPCSTGEEAYTLSMVLDAAQATKRFDYSICASDIDTNVLPIARNGVYRRSRLNEVPLQFHHSAFTFGTEDIKDYIRIKDQIRSKVTFKQCNLISPPFPWEHQFDIIFCRNVFIYFSPETVAQVVRNLYEVAKPGAFLFVGHSEALNSQTAGWTRIEPSIYQKVRKV